MLSQIIRSNNINVKGIIHIGANTCQEQGEYLHLTDSKNIFWIEADPSIVSRVKKETPSYQIFQELLTDKKGETINFNISSNSGLSSSIFEFDKHSITHPSIVFVNKVSLTSNTLDSFITANITENLPNIMVIDVQGAELKVLQGGQSFLHNVDVIQTEINIDYTYKGCGLVSEIDDLLQKYNFEKVHNFIWPNHTYGDAIYLKKN